VRIPYDTAIARKVIKDGQTVEPNQWDEDLQEQGGVKQEFCGENRFVGTKTDNIMEFYLTPGCQLEVAPRNAI
jgi:hypothetical protein